MKFLKKHLNEILPEAFAVIKETARRFKENTEITVTATAKIENFLQQNPISRWMETKLFGQIMECRRKRNHLGHDSLRCSVDWWSGIARKVKLPKCKQVKEKL
jgi:hypothetical protein